MLNVVVSKALARDEILLVPSLPRREGETDDDYARRLAPSAVRVVGLR